MIGAVVPGVYDWGVSNMQQNFPHLIMAVVVIVATSALAWHGTISGAEALAVIGTAGGFSLGAGSASASTSGVAALIPAISASTGTVTPTPSTPTAAATAPQNPAS